MRVYVEQLREVSKSNSVIDGSYILSKIEAKPFKNKPGFFLTCDLTDKTGSVKGVVWDRADILKECLKNKQVFKITGEATRYNDSPQIVIKTAVKVGDYDPADYMPSLDKDSIERYMGYLGVVSGGIKDPSCKKVWNAIIHPEEITYGEVLKRFRNCPGGVGDVIHHAYLGGLLEHTTSMIKIAEHFCKERPELDRDILLTGCLVHDIGKILTYEWTTVIEMTDQGRLLHHTTLGTFILREILLHDHGRMSIQLSHIIVSHHQAEGVRKPMTPEAEAVAQIDSLDAAIKGIQQYVSEPTNRQEEGNWTKFCNLTGRQYYMGENRPSENAPIPEPQRTVAPGLVEEGLF